MTLQPKIVEDKEPGMLTSSLHDLDVKFAPVGYIRRILVTCATGGCRQKLQITTRTGKLPAPTFKHAGIEYEIPHDVLDGWTNYDPDGPGGPMVKWM